MSIKLLAILVLFSACGISDRDLVAKVNGEGITKQQFDSEVERNLLRYKSQGRQLPPGIETRIRESILRRMINDKMIEIKAKELKIEVTDQEVDAKFNESKARFRTPEVFDDYLKRSGNTIESMKNELHQNMLRERLVEKMSGVIEVNDTDIKKYYEDNSRRFMEREQVHASRILFSSPKTAKPAEKKAVEKTAKKVLAQLKKKGADFAAIAKENSQGPEANKGGDLGWLTRGRMTPEFDNVVFGPKAPAAQAGTPANPAATAASTPDKNDVNKEKTSEAAVSQGLAVDAISDVIETGLGYEIIKVLERKPEHIRPLEEVKDSIKSSLLARKRNEKRRDVLRLLKSEAKVDQLVKFDVPPVMPTVVKPATAPAPESK
ncbi:MAG: peptidylprolyl isomerase [Deltaproteobacteria bacterium]|nr:peptidylprolyl isomerase [Deltaproteobacteria bacterium]